jgi:hypothetical protein
MNGFIQVEKKKKKSREYRKIILMEVLKKDIIKEIINSMNLYKIK